VIPNENGKKFPKYRFQPTLEIAFQHSKIEEQVQHGHPKNISKKASLCTQTGKTQANASSSGCGANTIILLPIMFFISSMKCGNALVSTEILMMLPIKK
jgi:hypothetical protein